MRYYFMYISAFIMFISCQKKKIEREYVYFSTKELKVDTLSNKLIEYKIILSSDSVKLLDNQSLITKFKYSIANEGIYLIKDTTSFLLYSFTESTNTIRPDELIPPFYKSVRLISKKDYLIKDKKRTVYHFVENGYDQTLDSYYMDGEGFICFYKYAEDHFIYLDSPDAIELSSQFLTDSTFFAMLKMRTIDKKMGRKF